MEGIRMHRDHRVPDAQQPVHDEPASGLDCHRQLTGIAIVGQLRHCSRDAVLGMRDRHAVHQLTGGVDHSHVMGSAGPVPTDEQRLSPSR